MKGLLEAAFARRLPATCESGRRREQEDGAGHQETSHVLSSHLKK
jgi:hypothetical protein